MFCLRWLALLRFSALLFVMSCVSRYSETSQEDNLFHQAPAAQSTCEPENKVQKDKLETKTPKLEDPYAYQLETRSRVIAIGDLHGDIEATRAALRLAGAIDGNDRWVAKDLVVVQVGDQIDRGDNDREILDLLDKLANEAVQHNSHLIILNGNHEFMNVALDMRYVTKKAFLEFENFPIPSPSQDLSKLELSKGNKYSIPGVKVHPKDPGVANRAHAFLPGAAYAKLLAKRSFFAIVNDTIFVHGGITPADLQYGLHRLNQEFQAWLRGEPKQPMPAQVFSRFGPLWNRIYSYAIHGTNQRKHVCDTLEGTLKDLHLERMVVGHTIQENGINSLCDNRLWRIDVGLSKIYQPKPKKPRVQVLEIINSLDHGPSTARVVDGA